MKQLHNGVGEPITREEWNLGAHYCPEFDYAFTFGERPEGGCYCRDSIGEYQSTHANHCLATHPANYEPCEHEFDPEPHGSRDTFVPPPARDESHLDKAYKSWDKVECDADLDMPCDTTTEAERIAEQERLFKLYNPTDTVVPPKCDDDFIKEMEAALDAVTEEDLLRTYHEGKPLPSPRIVTNKYPKAVHKHNDQWWFWEESHTVRYGPFNTEKEADDSLNRYCTDYLGEPKAPEKDPVLEAWKKELEKGGLDYDRNVQDY